MKRISLAPLAIALFFTGALYTSSGCGGSSGTPSGPQAPVATISGTVTDAASGNPLSGVTVAFMQRNSRFTTITSPNGRYAFGLPSTGEMVIEATLAGYATFSATFNVQQGGNTFDIRMQRAQ